MGRLTRLENSVGIRNSIGFMASSVFSLFFVPPAPQNSNSARTSLFLMYNSNMNEHIKNHLLSIANLKELAIETKNELSRNDKVTCDLYHILEYVKMDAVQRSQVTKKLATGLQKRRALKETHNALLLILDTSPAKLISFEEFEKRASQRALNYKKEAEENFKKYFE